MTPDRQTCKKCPPTSYKPTLSNTQVCRACPANTRPNSLRTTCQCLPNTYRASLIQAFKEALSTQNSRRQQRTNPELDSTTGTGDGFTDSSHNGKPKQQQQEPGKIVKDRALWPRSTGIAGAMVSSREERTLLESIVNEIPCKGECIDRVMRVQTQMWAEIVDSIVDCLGC